jgi:hypothetical protein
MVLLFNQIQLTKDFPTTEKYFKISTHVIDSDRIHNYEVVLSTDATKKRSSRNHEILPNIS